jgi:hypothetical protein
MNEDGTFSRRPCTHGAVPVQRSLEASCCSNWILEPDGRTEYARDDCRTRFKGRAGPAIAACRAGHRCIGVDFAADRRDQAFLKDSTPYTRYRHALSETPACAAFVCTRHCPTAILAICLENHLHVFTELNLVSDGYRA